MGLYNKNNLRYLHSTMFIFISVRSECSWVNFKIYIPLCLYLYLANHFYSIACYPNLHSTMFIFILQHDFLLCSATSIYIPLCLYLYFFLLFLCLSYLYLHSTMFIFILIFSIFSSASAIPFTFHYVYI